MSEPRVCHCVAGTGGRCCQDTEQDYLARAAAHNRKLMLDAEYRYAFELGRRQPLVQPKDATVLDHTVAWCRVAEARVTFFRDHVRIEVPAEPGVSAYVFAAPTFIDAVAAAKRGPESRL